MLGALNAVVHEGPSGLVIFRTRQKPGPAVTLRLRSLIYPILIRPASADVGSLVNNVFREEWGQLPRTFTPKVIIDAGAYIGDTSAYFLTRFPDARVIALEPNPESHVMASRNLTPYGSRVTLMRAALWVEIGRVRFSGGGTGARVSEDGEYVHSTTIPECIRLASTRTIDLLKIDIEGAEVAVIEGGVGSWLEHIRVLLLETHSAEAKRRLIPLLEHCGFRVHRYRNVWYCQRALDAPPPMPSAVNS
jgi:FkbM family methyltransferase